MSYSHHSEQHYIHRTGWLRAAVLGANDGIISVTRLIMGMAASGASTQTLLITCVAGLISGASSMAAGEYISANLFYGTNAQPSTKTANVNDQVKK